MEMTNRMFDRIYAENYSNLFKVAYRITGNSYDAEDVLQEAFMNAYKAFEGFKENSAVSTWLYRITVNSALKYIKHRKSFPVERMANEKGISVEDFFNSLKDYRQVEDEVLYNDMRETCIQMFTECLPIKQRLTFIMRVIMNFSVEETSNILEMSESAVKTNLYRGRETLKKAMDGKCSLINPQFPCKCKLWVNYAIENNKRELIQSFPVTYRDDSEIAASILSEINFLRKVSVLYNSEFRTISGEEFVFRIRKLMHQKNIKIFQ